MINWVLLVAYKKLSWPHYFFKKITTFVLCNSYIGTGFTVVKPTWKMTIEASHQLDSAVANAISIANEMTFAIAEPSWASHVAYPFTFYMQMGSDVNDVHLHYMLHSYDDLENLNPGTFHKGEITELFMKLCLCALFSFNTWYVK